MSYLRSPERQRQILDCAKRVFAERGFHAANISHICAAAGIGRGTLYQYFANKKAVFTAILRETLGRVRARMERQVLRRFPPPERLSRAQVVEYSTQGLREILGVVFADEETLRILLREAGGLDVDVEQLLGEIDDALIAIVEHELARAMEAGIVRELDPRITATLIVGGCEKAALAALRSDTPVDLDALAREAARLHSIGTLSDRVSTREIP
jgi:TetR/AcrR family fatty acid metabolism transcriptional regulator